MQWVWIWLGVVAVTLIMEFITMELVSVWFSFGAFVALILAACGVSLEIQWIVFGVVAILCILLLRKVSLKFLLKNSDEKVTKKDLTIGEEYELLTAITKDEKGTIKINDIVWSAVSEDGTELSAGTRVKVVELKGNKYVVKPVKVEKKEEK